jgi:hypothetical protein
MRYAFKAVDFGASVVFMAMCVGAFWRHFYNDVAPPGTTTQSFLSLKIRRRR